MNKNPFHYFVGEDALDQRIHLNEFAKSLRNLADKDYLACRSIYRRGHLIHAAYLGHQCIEKYFKSILLYLEVSTREFSHDILVLQEIAAKHGVVLNQRSINLVKQLDGLHNVSRYRSGSFYVDRSFIHELDYFVRDIRPNVQGRWVQKEEWIPHNPYQIMSGHKRKSCIIFMSGFLEKTMKSKKIADKKMREDLIWNNYHFYSRKRHRGLKFMGSYSSNFSYDLDVIEQRENARYVAKFYKFEPEIEQFLKSRREADSRARTK